MSSKIIVGIVLAGFLLGLPYGTSTDLLALKTAEQVKADPESATPLELELATVDVLASATRKAISQKNTDVARVALHLLRDTCDRLLLALDKERGPSP